MPSGFASQPYDASMAALADQDFRLQPMSTFTKRLDQNVNKSPQKQGRVTCQCCSSMGCAKQKRNYIRYNIPFKVNGILLAES
eukprot:75701-Amphidinium_carterae.1